jgi:hypothetical protein
MNRKHLLSGIAAGLFIVLISACNKELSRGASSPGNQDSNAGAAIIAVAADSAGTDSVYILQTCAPGYFRDSISASGLPDSASAYLSSNYGGYSFLAAFVIKDSAGTIGGYVAIIRYNGKPVAVLFNANGQFARVLEQRQRGDLQDQGWHHGGRFHNRDGRGGDTIAIASLPASVISYFSENYPNDTLLRAYLNIDSSYLVISADNGLFANLFSSTGTFVKRVSLQAPSPVIVSVGSDALPAGITSYLSATYPDYVFEKAYSFSNGSTLEGYIVVIDANSTKYAVQFDASGTFMAALTIW